MKTSDRILVGFGAGIAVLVLITIGLVLLQGRSAPPQLSADTPEGTVQAYLLAVKDGDYVTAQTYLLFPEIDPKNPRPYPYPQPYRSTSQMPAWKANLGKTSVSGDQATVEVMVDVFRGPNGPFDNPVRTQNIVYTLKKGPEGRWLITQPLDAYWIY